MGIGGVAITLACGSSSLSSFSLSGSLSSFFFFPVAYFFLFPFCDGDFEGDFFTADDPEGDDSAVFFAFLGGDLDF